MDFIWSLVWVKVVLKCSTKTTFLQLLSWHALCHYYLIYKYIIQTHPSNCSVVTSIGCKCFVVNHIFVLLEHLKLLTNYLMHLFIHQNISCTAHIFFHRQLSVISDAFHNLVCITGSDHLISFSRPSCFSDFPPQKVKGLSLLEDMMEIKFDMRTF